MLRGGGGETGGEYGAELNLKKKHRWPKYYLRVWEFREEG